MAELLIIVDNRERNNDLLENLVQNNIHISFKQLPIGDYILSDRMCVERKTISDFENSIIDSRLFEQADRLCRSFEKPILILEGEISETRLGRNVILGTILKLYREYNIQVINSLNPIETSYLLSSFAEKEQTTEKREPRLIGLKKAHTNYEWQLLILSSIPGVGTKIAVKLLQQFGSIKNVSNSNQEELAKIEKIGKKKANRIYSVLNNLDDTKIVK